jgi:hypothetical protein
VVTAAEASVHVLYLLVWIVVGYVLAVRQFGRRLGQ